MTVLRHRPTDILNNDQFFHGSDAELEVGDMLTPQSRTMKHQDPGERQQSVYLTPSRISAGIFGKHVYEAEPVGEVVPDEHAHIVPALQGAVRVPQARVVSTPKSRAQAARAMY